MSRKRTPPTLDVSWDPNPPKKEAATGCYSTSLHVNVGGDWQGGIPETVALTVRTGGRDFVVDAIDIHARHGEYPLTGLEAGKDYSIRVDAGAKRADCLLSVREPEKESRDDKKLKKLRRDKEIAETEHALHEAKAKLVPKPARILIDKFGVENTPGEHKDKTILKLTVLSEHSTGIPGALLSITDGQTTWRATTGDDGTVLTYAPRFTRADQEQNIVVTVAGTAIRAHKKLLAPLPAANPPTP
jgi:hypothetical protein